MMNAFTVDLEDWFCSHNLQQAISFLDWEKQESRVEKNTFLLLQLLQKHKVKATFFVLGWIAERFPELIKTIENEQHEIASHGYAHRLVTSLDRKRFCDDVQASTSIIKSITGKSPLGYRAPAFSINQQTSWAFPVLRQLGYKYDSSIYPFAMHPDYGFQSPSLTMHYPIDNLLEVPLTCYQLGHLRVPCSGGAYLRFYPYSMFSGLNRAVVKKNRPLIFYVHPWELDKHPPKVLLSISKSIRHYYNTSSSVDKINRLLTEFEFSSMQNVIKQQAHDGHFQRN
jgi:polysaccharide deacetylase family protein (PEP-CTERM system associated)